MFKFGDAVQIPGCSHKLRYLQTSSGNSGIDSLMGGAMPNTCVCIVDEQRTRAYGDVLLRYFLSEGAHNGHDLLTIGPAAHQLIDNLPPKIIREQDSASSSGRAQIEEDMKIAWRYSTVQQKSSMVTDVKNRYDLGKSLDNASFNGSTVSIEESLDYIVALEGCREILAKVEYSKKEKGSKKRLLRIVIRGLGSPLWESSMSASLFLCELRMLCRDAYVVVMATTDSTTLKESVVRRFETLSDAFFRLIAIKDEEKKSLPVLDKYHGYFQIIRLPHLTSLTSFKPSAVDLVFELHRKSFDVKVLHLPPAFEDPSPAQNMGCSQVTAAF